MDAKLSGAGRPIVTWVMVMEPLGERLKEAKRRLYSVIDFALRLRLRRRALQAVRAVRSDWTGGLVAAEAICRWFRFRDWLKA